MPALELLLRGRARVRTVEKLHEGLVVQPDIARDLAVAAIGYSRRDRLAELRH